MERVPVPEDSGRDLTQTLRLLERAHIEGQLDAHDHYAIPLLNILDAKDEVMTKSLFALDTLINRLLHNLDIKPEEWALHLKPDTALSREARSTEGISAAAFLYQETVDNIFSRTEDGAVGGAALLFSIDDNTTVELRGTSQYRRARIYEHPQTSVLLSEPDDQELIDLLKQEHGQLIVMDDRIAAEFDFIVFFDREKTRS